MLRVSHYFVEDCKLWLLSTLCWIAKTRDFLKYRKQVLCYHYKSRVSASIYVTKIKTWFSTVSKQKTTTTTTTTTTFIIIVKRNLKASEIIDCTCTIASISSIARFAFANVWSVCVVTDSVYLTFAGICFAFVNICQKREKREKNKKIGFGFHSRVMYVHVWKK